MPIANVESSGVPGVMPGGRPTSRSAVMSMGCGDSGPGTSTGCPSLSSNSMRTLCLRFAASHGTSNLIASADGVGAGPVIDHPPPSTYSLPATACALSASIMMIFQEFGEVSIAVSFHAVGRPTLLLLCEAERRTDRIGFARYGDDRTAAGRVIVEKRIFSVLVGGDEPIAITPLGAIVDARNPELSHLVGPGEHHRVNGGCLASVDRHLINRAGEVVLNGDLIANR